jgi:predicted PurR-regulated permease PerM
MSRLISFAVLVAITLVISLLFYRVLAGFFVPLFLAIILVVVFQPIYRWVLARTNNRRHLAAGLTTLMILLCLLLPVGAVFATAAVQGLRFIEQNSASSVGLRLMKIRSSFEMDMPQWGEVLRQTDYEMNRLVSDVSDAKVARWDETYPGLGEALRRSLQDLKRELQFQYGEQWNTEAVDELIELAEQLGAVEQSAADGQPEGEEESVDLSPAEKVLKLKSGFGALKRDLHGGSFQMFIRDLVNPTQEDVEAIRSKTVDYVRPRLLGFTQATGMLTLHLVFGTLIMAVAVYFFLVDGPTMIQTLLLLVPLEVSYEQELLEEFVRTSRSIVLAMLLAALAQGLTAGVGYAVAGLDYLVLLIMLTSLAALIPFVGPMAVWVPVCIYMSFFEERYLAATLLAVWGMAVVGTIDNIVKAFVLHGQASLHPLLALLSILGGVQALGAVGLVVGPMAVSLLQTLLGIVRRELIHFESHGLTDSRVNEEAARGSTSEQVDSMASKSDSKPQDADNLPESTTQDPSEDPAS